MHSPQESKTAIEFQHIVLAVFKRELLRCIICENPIPNKLRCVAQNKWCGVQDCETPANSKVQRISNAGSFMQQQVLARSGAYPTTRIYYIVLLHGAFMKYAG